MQLRFLGKHSNPDDSPTLYAAANGNYVVQGYVVTDPAILARLDLADDETIVSVPPILLTFLGNDGLPSQLAAITTPIVAVTDDGDYIVRGTRITDPETLAQMRIPAGETCVEVTRSDVLTLVGQ